jgi:hypothetical protein
MTTLRTHFFLILITLAAFVGPFIAVVAIEKMKQEAQETASQNEAISAKNDTETARYQYYLGIAQQREALRKTMVDAKSQYDALVSDQPKLIKDNQKTVTQTTIEPVVTQQVVTVPVTTTTSKPKSSAKTKTS